MIKILKKILKWILWIILFIIIWAVGILAFSYYEYRAGYTGLSIEERAQFQKIIQDNPIILSDSGSLRRTGNTFMSIPEWYIVSISDDYTKWLEAGNNPSNFPYWTYLADYWKAYGKLTAIMDGVIPRDYEYHTMVQVIGVSTTFELGLKSLYEWTIGRLTSIASYTSEVDTFYSESSRRYVSFILLRPWYEFDYGKELASFPSITSENFMKIIRNTERKMVYGFEFFMKKHYAKAIEEATRESFATPDIYTTVEGSFSGVDVGNFSGVVQQNEKNLKIPRYYPFTETFPKVTKKYPDITSIAGNTYIVTEYMNDTTNVSSGNIIMDIPVPINPILSRTFSIVKISEISSLLDNSKNLPVHIYDF